MGVPGTDERGQPRYVGGSRWRENQGSGCQSCQCNLVHFHFYKSERIDGQEAHAVPRSNDPHVPIDSYVESTATSTSVCGYRGPRSANCAGQLVKASAHANSMAEGSSWSIRPVGTDERGEPRMLQGVCVNVAMTSATASSVAVDSTGTVYVVDHYNNQVVKLARSAPSLLNVFNC